MSESPAPAKPEMSSLFMDFARYFEIGLALTVEQKQDVFKIRYNVYCEEFGYEDPDQFKNRLEHDEFDDKSIHCLVTHKASGTPAGCVRLILVDENSQMPLEEHCGDGLDRQFFDGMAEQRSRMAEVSRLAVDGQFRRRRGEKETRFGNTESLHFEAREKRTFSLLAVSLFLASAAVADLMRRPHCFAIMEPFLPSILRRTGIPVQRVGQDFEFNGTRAPYFLSIDEAIRTAPDDMRLCFEVVKSQFAESLNLGDRIASGQHRSGSVATLLGSSLSSALSLARLPLA